VRWPCLGINPELVFINEWDDDEDDRAEDDNVEIVGDPKGSQ
jgi:hypothetical protein